MTDHLTILRSASNKHQTKIWQMTPAGLTKTGFSLEKWYWVDTVEVGGIADLGGALEALVEEPTRMVIRGAPAPGLDLAAPVLRRSTARVNAPATFVDTPRQWLHSDVDGVSAPHIDVISDPAGGVMHVLDLFAQHAPELEGVTCWWCYSSSAGVKDVTAPKLHIWWWLDRPYQAEELRRWAAAVNARAGIKLVDPALFGAVQPNYCARPIFKGMPDPLPGRRRFALQAGDSDAATLAIPAKMPRQAVGGGSGGRVWFGDLSFRDHLAQMGGERGLREPAMAAVKEVIKAKGADAAEPCRDDVLAEIAEALRNADPGDRSEDVVQGYIDGLTDMWAWTIDRQRASEAEGAATPPTYADRSFPLDVAQTKLHGAIADFFTLAADHLAAPEGKTPPVHAIQIDMGVGKTSTAIAAIAAGPHRVAYLVDRHKLGTEVQASFAERGIQAHVWRGMRADDPDRPGQKMCTEPELEAAGRRAGISSVVCRACPAQEGCAYQAQRAAPAAQVELGAHNFCFTTPPARIAAADVLVIDETFFGGALDHEGAVLLSALDSDTSMMSTFDRADLEALRGQLRRALAQAIERGALTRQILEAQGLTPEICRQAAGLEWQRKPRVEVAGSGRKRKEGGRKADLVLPANATATELLKAIASIKVAFTAAVPNLWRTVGQFLEGQIPVSQTITPVADLSVGEAGSGPGVVFHWRDDIAAAWGDKPVLIMDGTLPEAIVRTFFPTVEVVADIEAARPHVTVEQLIDPLPTSALVDKVSGEAKAKLREAADRIEVIARTRRGQGEGAWDVLVVATQTVEVALRGLLADRGLDRVAVRHYGDLTGENAYSGVREIIALGWCLPPAGAMERAAAVLGADVSDGVGSGAWPLRTGGLRQRSGQGYGVEVPTHPDPTVEALRWINTEGRMVQAIARAREVRRTAANPLTIRIWSPLPLPGMTADRLVRWKDVVPLRHEIAASRLGGVLPLRPADLHQTGLWETLRAARHASIQFGPLALREALLKGDGPNWIVAHYRRPGAKGRLSTAMVRADLTATEAQARLAAATGCPDLVVDLGEHACPAPTVAAPAPIPDPEPFDLEALRMPAYTPRLAQAPLELLEALVPPAAFLRMGGGYQVHPGPGG